MKNGIITADQLQAAIDAQDTPPRPAHRRNARRTGLPVARSAGPAHPRTDRGGGVLPVHLDAGHVQLRGRRAAPTSRSSWSRSIPSRCCSRARGGWTSGALDREEDPDVRHRLRHRPAQAADQRRGADARTAGAAGAGRRPARRAADHRRVGPRGVRRRQAALRAGHRRGSCTASARRRPPSRRCPRRASRSTTISAWPSTRPGCSTRRCGSSAAWSTCGERQRGPVLHRAGAPAPGAVGRGARRATSRRRPSRRRCRPCTHNLAFALERLGRSPKPSAPCRKRPSGRRQQPAHPDLARHAGPARPATSCGADEALAAARPLWAARPPSPAWYHYSALVAALLGDTAARPDGARRGRGRAPARAVLYNNLAVVLERRNAGPAAAAALDRALAEDARRAPDPQEPRRHRLPRRATSTRRSRPTSAR